MPEHFRNASWSGFAAAFRAASGIFNVLLAARLLGTENYGHVATLLSLFVLYLSLNSGVFTALVVKLMAPDARESHVVMRASSTLFGTVSITVLLVVTLLMSEYAPRLMSIQPGTVFTAEIRRVVYMMGVLTTIQIIVARYSALIESAGRLDLATKSQLVGPTVVLVILALYFFAGRSLAAFEYVMALSAGALTDLGLLWFIQRQTLAPSTPCALRQRVQGLKHLLKSGGVLQATSLMGMFLEPLNKLLLNHFVGPSAVTIYDLAMKVVWGIQYLFSAAMRVFLHLGSQDSAAIWPTFFRTITLIGVPAIILHVVGALFLSWVAHHWLMISATELMLFYAIATLSNLGMIYIMPLYISLIGQGDLLFIFRSQAILAMTNVVVTLALLPHIGLLGAAFGLLSATIYNVIAIFNRCKATSTTLEGRGKVQRKRQIAYGLTALLFCLAILLGISGGDNLGAVLVVLLVLTAIAVREPIVAVLLMRTGLKR